MTAPFPSSRWREALWTLAALATFSGAAYALCSDAWSGDLRRVVPTPQKAFARRQLLPERRIDLLESDQRFVVWATAHAAEHLATDPARLFDARPCHPAENALAYGHPLVSFGLLGLPAWIATGDPILTYNVAYAAMLMLGALAMFLLVRDWTGIPAAGIAAGLLYAFSSSKVAYVNWPFITNTGWAVLGLFFVRRFFARGHVFYGVAAALSCVLQMAVSMYPVLAAVFVALPLLAWLFYAYGTAQLRPMPTLASLTLLVIGAAAIYGPYLEVHSAQRTLESSKQVFTTWSTFLPGGTVSWTIAVLATAGMTLPTRTRTPTLGGDPRWALAGAIVLVAVLATGGNQAAQAAAEATGDRAFAVPSLYAALAVLVPGLDTVRLPGMMSHGAHLAASILAGLGAAGLIRLAPERGAHFASALLITLIALSVVRPPALGLTPPVHHGGLELRPDEDVLRFYEVLDELGNEGPLLELPINLKRPGYVTDIASRQMLLTSYHGRRTSGCYNSYGPPTLGEVDAAARELPSADSIHTLRAMGFTTIVVHGAEMEKPRRILGPLERAASTPGTGVRNLHRIGSLHAFTIAP